MKPAEIRARLQSTGRSQMALARHLGKGKDSISRLLKGDRGLDVEEAAQIKSFFDGQDSAPEFEQIDVYGYAAAGSPDRVAFTSDQILDRIEVPRGIVRGEAVAIRVAGESMEPRLYSGEIVIVALGMMPSRYGDCVIELKDGTALVKQYVGHRDGHYSLNQLNPEKNLLIEQSRVKAVHAVVYRR